MENGHKTSVEKLEKDFLFYYLNGLELFIYRRCRKAKDQVPITLSIANSTFTN